MATEGPDPVVDALAELSTVMERIEGDLHRLIELSERQTYLLDRIAAKLS